MQSLRLRPLILTLALGAAFAAPAQAQPYPNKPIHFVIPGAAGSALGAMTRPGNRRRPSSKPQPAAPTRHAPACCPVRG